MQFQTPWQKNKQNYCFLNNRLSLFNAKGKKQILSLQQTEGSYVLIDTLGDHNTLRIYKQKFSNLRKEAQIYQWRNLTNKPIPKIYLIQPFPSTNTLQISGYVYTQNLIKTLDYASDITIQQALGLLKTFSCGYQAIFRILGYVSIDLAFCGVNAKGDCKVWINSNFSSNNIKKGFKILRNQSQIVYQILRLIRSITSFKYQFFFIELNRHLDLSENCSFAQILAYVQQYMKQHQLNMRPITSFSTQKQNKSPNRQLFTSLQTLKDDSRLSNLNLNNPKDFVKPQKTQSCNRNNKTRKTFHYQLQFRTSPQSIFQDKKLPLKKQLRVTQQLINNHKTQRKNNYKRNSVVINPTQRLNQFPKFLTKKSIHSPKYLKTKTSEKQENGQFNKKSEIFNVCDFSNFSEIQKNIKNNQKDQKEVKNKNNNRKLSIQYGSIHSLNNILAEISQRNEQNQTQRQKYFKKIENIKSKRNFRNRQSSCHFCHQFSINIINDGTTEFRSLQGLKLKKSLLSTNKTYLDSQKSSPYKYVNSLFYDSRKKKQPYISQMINRQSNQFTNTNKQCFRRNSGQKGDFGRFGMHFETIKNSINDIKDSQVLQQSMQQSGQLNQLKQRQRMFKKENNLINNESFSFSVNSIQNQGLSKGQYAKKVKNLRQQRNKEIQSEQNNMKAQIKAKQQQIINANSWKKTISNLLGQQQQKVKLNQSISYGQQLGGSTVRLQKLMKIGRDIKASIIPIQQTQ